MSGPIQGPFVSPGSPGGGQNVPTIGVGIPSGSNKLHFSAIKSAILHAIEIGYRHIQTTISNPFERDAAGEAIVEALENGLVESREELFITCKFQYNDGDHAGSDIVIQDLKKFLENAHVDHIDLYLIEQPNKGEEKSEQVNDDVPSTDTDQLMLLWSAMEECQRLGLAKSIGVCNFNSRMLKNVIKHAKIHPWVNQVGMQMLLRDKELRKICLDNKISIIASSTNIGEQEKHMDFTQFMELEASENIAKDRKRTHNEVVFSWAHERGAALLLESMSKEHMQEILNIFKWKLSQDHD